MYMYVYMCIHVDVYVRIYLYVGVFTYIHMFRAGVLPRVHTHRYLCCQVENHQRNGAASRRSPSGIIWCGRVVVSRRRVNRVNPICVYRYRYRCTFIYIEREKEGGREREKNLDIYIGLPRY